MNMKLENYTLENCIGKGMLTEVYLTSKKDDPKKYVTKMWKREDIDNSEYKMYLNNSIIILKNLNHSNIIKIQDIKKSKKHYFVMLEFCNGGDLSKALEKYIKKYGKPFDEKIVQHFMKQIINAFKYIHEKKIIHRNITLDNILLNYDDEEDEKNFNLMKANIKLSGFGFSCQIKEGGLKYSIVGSSFNINPLFLKNLISSTKKAKSLGYNEMADIWSIGTICYEMLIGKPIFDSEDMDELIKKIEDGSYSIPTTMSHEVVSFLNGMLQYDSKRRLNAEQLARHDFLNKDIKDFHSINLQKVSKKVDEKGLKLNANAKNNASIWSIFNADSENLLTSIAGSQFVKPVDENEKIAFENLKKIEPNVSTSSLLQLPTKGIPDNPTEAKEEYKDFNYTFDSPAEDLFS